MQERVPISRIECRGWGIALGRLFEVVPRHQLVREECEGVERYLSLGEDPQFDVLCEGGIGCLVPGWYRLQLRLRVVDGFIVAPCLYADYGDGPSEATRIDLPEPDPDGRIEAVIVVAGRMRALRFDPTIHRACFELGALALTRISRLSAAWAMCRALGMRTPHPLRGAVAAGWHLLRGAARGRLGMSAAALQRQYASQHRQPDRGYAHWLQMFCGAAVDGVAESEALDLAPGSAPLFSVLLPVANTPPRLLEACVASVLAQTTDRWQLCIADDASTDAEMLSLLQRLVDSDPRIRLVRGADRVGISENTNRALGIAAGAFVCFLDHDDELAPTALEEMAAAIARFPAARMLYSDEDKLDERGHRSAPHFKPAWNPELLRSLNYIGHLAVIETALVRAVGGLRREFDGAQDHDLVLRCAEKLEHDQIVHVPRVLYHWRAMPGSTALGVQQKPYALDAGRRAIEAHLARIGDDSEVRVLADGRYRVVRRLPDAPPHVSIIVPTRDRLELLRPCIESILEHTHYPSFDVVIVDNGSTDPETLAWLSEMNRRSGVSVLPHPAPFNFSELVNRGVAHSRGELICLLNNDVEVIDPDWLREMASHARRPKIGVVGAMLYYPDDTIQHAGVILGMGGVAGHSHMRLRRGSDGYVSRARVVQNLTAVTGACMMFRREVFDKAGGFDEQLAVAFNDIDFCMRVHACGFFNLWTPFAELYHHESASRGAEDTPAKQARFALESQYMKRRWGDALSYDPYYNPNLSLDSHCFELAFPPRAPACRTHRLVLSAAA